MPFFLTLQSVQTLMESKLVDGIKMELFGVTITRKIILEGGANDAPLTVFKTTSHYNYDHNGCTDFAISRKYSACKCQDCKVKYDEVINAINALTASVKEMTSKRGVIPSKRISYPDTPLEIKMDVTVEATTKEHKSQLIIHQPLPKKKRRSGPSSEIQKLAKILPTYLDMSGSMDQKVRTDWSTIEAYRDKMDNPFDVQYVEGIAQQTISSLDCGPFVATYGEYLSDGLQVTNDGLDVGLLRKRYAALLWKYGEAKA
ncbi:hypothetical protein T459_02270 [Capsicum annuum]|uniref:Ubiquitin-like protease family profile domain-containing protein n=1 Tax=Capsicum annuum TaxID=4072 RepID=A0A2G3AJM3_CAPAN|nr:putative protein EIN4-like [Capsicum annuum]PHT94388.1 hypothetical protein T459_02270 [Capsicum annuum]